MVTQRVSFNNEQRLKKYLQEAVKVPLIKGEIENATERAKHAFKAHAYENIIVSLVELPTVETARAKRRIIESALRKVANQRDHKLSAFKNAVGSEVRDYTKQPIKRYHVVCLTNVAEDSLQDSCYFTVRDIQLHVWTWSEAKSKLTLDPWENEWAKRLTFGQSLSYGESSAKKLLQQFTPLVTEVRSRTEARAVDKVEKAYDILRALFNMEFTFNRYHFEGWQRERLGKIIPSPSYAVFDEKYEYIDSDYDSLPALNFFREGLPDKLVNNVKTKLDRLNRPQKDQDTRNLLLQAVRLYGSALDTTKWSEAFLALWQVLEIITKPDNKYITMKSVRERATALIEESVDGAELELLNGLLELSYDKRNTLVHTGTFPEEGLRAVCMLKIVVEQCILALDNLRQDISTSDELLHYYKYARKQSSDLDDIKRTIAIVEKRRS